jgi:hypothetical protein
MEETRNEGNRSAKIVKTFLAMQAVALAAGNYVGWTTILKEVNTYCGERGRGLWSLTDFTGGLTRNPLASACFWGSIVFLVAFAWTVSLLIEKSPEKLQLNVRRLWWLLLGGTLFALANNVPVVYKFYTRPVGTFSSCSAGAVTNPYLTSCFLGFCAFLAAFIIAIFAKRAVNKLSAPEA